MMMIGKLLRLGRRQLHTIISREVIKPSSPTPSLHHTYNLSELDQLFGHIYMPLILYYPNNGSCSLTAHEKAEVLKQSLSKSLTKYYPFAGRLPTPVKPSYIDCNDEGVVFVEAKNDSPLTTFRHVNEEAETLDQLFADNLVGQNSPQSRNVAGVQLNHFACGGAAVTLSLWHGIGDASTLASFASHWASVSRYGSTDHQEVVPINPHFIDSPRTSSVLPESQVMAGQDRPNWVKRRFVFPNSKLSDLKNKVAAINNNNPTRVEVLFSLLYKTAVSAATKKSGCFQPSCMLILVDIRKRFVHKLPQTTVGNLLSATMIPTRHQSDTSLSLLASEIKKVKLQLEGVQSVQHAAENIKSLVAKMGNETKRTYTCSSACGFPYDKVDFGWGKPTCATFPVLKAVDTNGFVLMDAPNGDGIEVIVILEKEEMEIFENDKELLSFCQI
ncbi:hypothetical protein SSX86_019970 [Deinandra increscens subsp. villosa]|uniref:Uncharacterized protein n=1 Tax=Deinandra increscens subsp. villosa TaxID=3103831 RepID=A0AAP0CYD4_9ASTR